MYLSKYTQTFFFRKLIIYFSNTLTVTIVQN